MNAKKQATDKPTERRSEAMPGQRSGSYDPTKPDAPKRQAEVPEEGKNLENEGSPFAKPGAKTGREGFPDEGERSDRSSGRPLQLDEEQGGRRESSQR
jgi:hypothetical protein